MKKILSLAIVLVLIITLSLTGCSKEAELTNLEKYDKLTEVSSALESFKMEFDSTMNMTMESDNEEVAAQLDATAGMFENLKFSGVMDLKKTEKIGDLAATYKMEMNGMTFDIEAYFDGDKFIINYPMMPKYIVIDINELIGMANETGQLGFDLDYNVIISNLDSVMADFTRISKEITFENIKEEDIEYIEEYTFNFKGEEIIIEALKVNINMDDMPGYMLSLLEKFKDVESFRNVVDLVNTEEDVTMDVYNSYIDLAIEEMNKPENDLTSVYDNMTINQYDIILGYDEEYNMTNYDMIMSYDMYEESTEMNISMEMNMAAKLSEHNNVLEVTIPEMTDENSMSIMELLGGMY